MHQRAGRLQKRLLCGDVVGRVEATGDIIAENAVDAAITVAGEPAQIGLQHRCIESEGAQVPASRAGTSQNRAAIGGPLHACLGTGRIFQTPSPCRSLIHDRGAGCAVDHEVQRLDAVAQLHRHDGMPTMHPHGEHMGLRGGGGHEWRAGHAGKRQQGTDTHRVGLHRGDHCSPPPYPADVQPGAAPIQSRYKRAP
ncbi:hypothetical protein D3C81_1465050 [compost metagenome]